MVSLRAAYPNDADYFDETDLGIILHAATSWMGDELPGAYMCLAGAEFKAQESWEERVLLYVENAENIFTHYEKD
tara:strand:+ start:1094 stop:1318 length:225 start_codon:yes stop_codon:yes gene_type:complete